MAVVDTPPEPTIQPDTSVGAPRPTPPPPAGPGIGFWLGFLIFAGLVLFSVPISMFAIFGDSGQAQGVGVATTVVDVSLSEFTIGGDLEIPAGNVILRVTNDGSMVHNLVIEALGVRTPNIDPGRSFELDLGQLTDSSYEAICDIPGHREAGMVTTLTIGAGGGLASMDHSAMMSEEQIEAMEQKMLDTMLSFPAETEGKGNQLLAPTILADGTKQFELTAAITPWEVAPGDFVEAWTYNGMAPGPQIIVDVGDKVQVVLHNETPLSTDIHWHGVHTPNDQDGVAPFTQDAVQTGDTYVYEFVAEDPAIGMYHAHMHSQLSVLNGMFGSIIIGERPYPVGRTISGVTIPEDLVIAQELPMVLNDAGVIGLTLNGKSFPATEPLVTNVGDWISVHYYNEGLSAHPMHLHQFPQLVYAKDGIPLDAPYWADTINIAPGERYSVIFQTTDPGVWVWHCHILTHVENADGMFGMVTAVIVNELES
jgi:FtsP/CotA-like multicopper oxidase with cupredoxin domain